MAEINIAGRSVSFSNVTVRLSVVVTLLASFAGSAWWVRGEICDLEHRRLEAEIRQLERENKTLKTFNPYRFNGGSP